MKDLSIASQLETGGQEALDAAVQHRDVVRTKTIVKDILCTIEREEDVEILEVPSLEREGVRIILCLRYPDLDPEVEKNDSFARKAWWARELELLYALRLRNVYDSRRMIYGGYVYLTVLKGTVRYHDMANFCVEG